jgi:chemotaxis protein CheD
MTSRATSATSPTRPEGRTRRVIGIAEMIVSTAAQDYLVTYALGSCIGVTVFDEVAGVGGLLHLMLPQAALSPERAAEHPLMCADTGLPMLFHEAYRLGAKKERLVVTAAGGASVALAPSEQGVGQRNITMLRKLLWKNGVLLRRHDLGGGAPRTLALDLASGSVVLSTAGESQFLYQKAGT